MYRLVLAVAVLLVLAGAAWQLLRAGVAAVVAAPQYVLVIDAGSSGTRLLAYSWTPAAPGPGGAGAPPGVPLLTPIPPSAAADHVPRRALGKRRAYARVETEPGLDAYVGDAEGMEARALRPLLDWARAALPRAAWASTPVFLLGTAGLRRLPAADQRWVLEAASAALARSAFRFERAWARVLGGEDEGVYGWVALNYLQGTLAPGGENPPEQQQQTVGALDLGGSSLEVSFTAPSVAGASDRVNVSVLGTSHSLYVHTHHHFGLNDAFERSVGLLLRHGSSPVPLPLSVSHNAAAAAASGGSVDGGAALKAAPSAEGRSAAAGAKAAGKQPAQTNRAAAGAAAAEGGGSVGGTGSRRQLLAVPEALVRRLQGSRGLQDRRRPYRELQRMAGAADLRAAEARWLQRPLREEEQLAQTAGTEAPGRRQLLSDGLLPGVAAAEGRRMYERSGGEKPPQQQQQQQQGSVKDLPAVRHPCLHAGYRQPYKRLVVGGSPPSPPEVLLLGAPDWRACEALARAVVNASGADCPACALGAPQPATGGRRFFALAGFYVVYHFLGLPTSASLAQVREAGRTLCETPWAAVSAAHAGEIHVDRYCFRQASGHLAPYIASLLTEGLKLREAQLAVGSPQVSWTMGAALVEGYRLGGLAQADASRGGGGPSAARAAAAVLLPRLRALTPRAWALAVTAAACVWYFSAWWRQRRSGGGGWGRGPLDKRRSVEAAEVELRLLPLASPPRLAAPRLQHSGGAGSGSARALSPAPGGSGGWAGSLASPRSPLQALGAAARLLGAPRFAKRRSQSWAAFGPESGGGLASRDVSYGSSLNRLGRTQTFARRAIGTLVEDA